jgi:hypothetical protein
VAFAQMNRAPAHRRQHCEVAGAVEREGGVQASAAAIKGDTLVLQRGQNS